MFLNYLKITLRNLSRHKGYSFINIAGLATGMACVIIIMLWVQHETTYDKFHKEPDNVYRVILESRRQDGISKDPWVPYPLARALKDEFPGITASSNMRGDSHTVRHGEKVFNETRVMHVNAGFFKVFTPPVVHGDPDTMMSGPASAVISEKTAKRYFGHQSPIGKRLTIDGTFDVEVTGVVRIPAKTDLQFDIYLNFGIYNKISLAMGHNLSRMESDWKVKNYNAFVRLAPNVSVQEVEKQIARFLKKYNPNRDEVLHLMPAWKVHLYNPDGSPHLLKYIYIFSLVALFILVIACINFMNLSTARSMQRAKEVGVRKTVGSLRSQLIKQFFVESTLLALVSCIVALGLVEILLPAFSLTSGRELTLDLFSPPVFLSLGGLVLLTGLLAGSYPALVLSSFRPAAVLKGSFDSSRRGSRFRKALVIFQFFLSIALIICTSIVSSQLKYIRTRDMGMDKEHLVYLALPRNTTANPETLKRELVKHPAITDATVCQELPFDLRCWAGHQGWEGMEPDRKVFFAYTVVDYDFFKTFKMKMVQGQQFSPERPSDAAGYVINEEAVRQMGLKNPIGKQLRFWGYWGKIIGVVKDFNFRHASFETAPLIMTMRRVAPRNMLVLRLAPGDPTEAIEHFRAVWGQMSPGSAFDYRFTDQEFDKMYKQELMMEKLLKGFSLLAVLISCLGLFGLASFTAQQKTKEIGIRKALGAGVWSIVFMFSRQFLKWVLIANLIAWPVSYYFMARWLQGYVYRAPLDVTIFIFAGLLAAAIAMATVAYQSIKAATANPITALRCE